MSTATAAAGPWNKRSLRHLLERTGEFATVVELVNSRGVITERGGSKVMQLARGLADLPGIHALSITDNPGGNAVLSADTLGFDLLSRGQDVIIHLSCKDWNRNGLQSHAWQLASEGFESILALSGDYPADGYSGRASGVFDIDSVGLLKMLSDMNQGLETRTPRGRRARCRTAGRDGTRPHVPGRGSRDRPRRRRPRGRRTRGRRTRRHPTGRDGAGRRDSTRPRHRRRRA